MDKKNLIILINFDKYVELQKLDEYNKRHRVYFANLSNGGRKAKEKSKRNNEFLFLDLKNELWMYNHALVSIGNHGQCQRDETIVKDINNSSYYNVFPLIVKAQNGGTMSVLDYIIGVYDSANFGHLCNLVSDSFDASGRRQVRRDWR